MQTIHDWVDVRARLTRELARFFQAPTQGALPLYRYALVDAAQVPDMRGPQFEAEGIEHVSLFTLTREHAIAKYGPLLIPLSPHASASSPSVAKIVRAMRHGWTVSWLSSPMDLKALSEHLAGHLNGTLSDGSDVLVRYYDPRLLPGFLENLDRATCSALLGPIAWWCWWDRKLDFVMRAGPAEAASAGVVDTQISPATKDAMAEAARLDLLASMVFAECDPQEFEEWLPHTMYHAVERQMRRARALGLTEMGDLQLFVSLALRVHPDFFTLLPVFGREHQRILEGESDLPSLVLAVDDAEWDRIGASGSVALTGLRQAITKELSSLA